MTEGQTVFTNLPHVLQIMLTFSILMEVQLEEGLGIQWLCEGMRGGVIKE